MWSQDQDSEPQPGGDAPAIVDWELFSRARAELGPGFIRMLGYFREDGEKSVAAIETALRRKDSAALVTPAHTLKSEARQFGAEPLAELAEEIEDVARHCLEMKLTPEDLLPAVARLRPLYRQTIELFDQEANPRLQRRPGGRSQVTNQDFGRI